MSLSLNQFIEKLLFIEAEGPDGTTLWEDVRTLAHAYRIAAQQPVHPLKFALHLRSIIPTIRVEEIAPDEIIVFGLSLKPEARNELNLAME